MGADAIKLQKWFKSIINIIHTTCVLYIKSSEAIWKLKEHLGYFGELLLLCSLEERKRMWNDISVSKWWHSVLVGLFRYSQLLTKPIVEQRIDPEIEVRNCITRVRLSVEASWGCKFWGKCYGREGVEGVVYLLFPCSTGSVKQF